MALTKKDIEKLSNVFATKEELNRLTKKFATKADFLQIKESLDWLVGAVSTIKEELTVRFSQYRRHDDQIENHEQRIKKVEEKVLV